MSAVADRTRTFSLNTNPLAFEELVTSLASLTAYAQAGDMAVPVDEFQRLYAQALRQPANYTEITELTGEALSPGDRRAGRAAWLLMNVESLKVYGVHSLVWHKKKKRYSAPIVDQLSRVLKTQPRLSDKDRKHLGIETIPLDVVGIKEGEIWVVQGLHEKVRVDSAVTGARQPRLFRGSVFEDVVLDGENLIILQSACDLMQHAFPDIPCHPYALVIHPQQPDFELYHVDLRQKSNGAVTLEGSRIKTNSVDHEERLRQDHDSLWALAHRFDDDLFRGLPPCRGGRTLAILASAAKRQLESEKLLAWKERDISGMLRDDFDWV
jgi:hypothetical protein